MVYLQFQNAIPRNKTEYTSKQNVYFIIIDENILI